MRRFFFSIHLSPDVRRVSQGFSPRGKAGRRAAGVQSILIWKHARANASRAKARSTECENTPRARARTWRSGSRRRAASASSPPARTRPRATSVAWCSMYSSPSAGLAGDGEPRCAIMAAYAAPSSCCGKKRSRRASSQLAHAGTARRTASTGGEANRLESDFLISSFAIVSSKASNRKTSAESAI